MPRYIRIASSLWQMARIVTDTKNVIEFKGHAYARLGFAPPSKAELEPSPRREEYRYCELPAGWELAPKDPEIVAEVIAKHCWGIQVLVVSDGTGYNTLAHPGHTPGSRYGTNFHTLVRTLDSSTRYCINHGGIGILIRTTKSPSSWSAAAYRARLLSGIGQKRKFTDCEMRCVGVEIFCHRSVLAEASPVFASMLEADSKEGKSQCITIKNEKPHIVKAMVDFIYTGQLSVKDEDVAGLLAQADVYQMDALMRACAEQALKIINADNAVIIARSMRPLASMPEGKLYFHELLEKLKSDEELLGAVVMGV